MSEIIAFVACDTPAEGKENGECHVKSELGLRSKHYHFFVPPPLPSEEEHNGLISDEVRKRMVAASDMSRLELLCLGAQYRC